MSKAQVWQLGETPPAESPISAMSIERANAATKANMDAALKPAHVMCSYIALSDGNDRVVTTRHGGEES